MFILIISKIFSGSKCPKKILLNHGNRSTARQPDVFLVGDKYLNIVPIYTQGMAFISMHPPHHCVQFVIQALLQVGLAKFLEYVLDESERNGNALPLLVAHNAPFDVEIVLCACCRVGLDVPSCWHVGDTFALARSIASEECDKGLGDPFAMAQAIRTSKELKRDGKKLLDLCHFFG